MIEEVIIFEDEVRYPEVIVEPEIIKEEKKMSKSEKILRTVQAAGKNITYNEALNLLKPMKIDTYFIPPKKQQEIALKGDRLFCLAHFVLKGDIKYIQFFKDNSGKCFITLDSGVAEGYRVPVNQFMECAKKINATEIICPDELYEPDKTLALTKEFLSQISEEDKKRFKFMMVPQAKNIQDYVRCLKELQAMPECSCIGISKFDAPKLFGHLDDKHIVFQSRVRLMDYLVENKILTKPVHLLGYDCPLEFQYYMFKRYTFIRSCDSACAIQLASLDRKLDIYQGLHKPKPAGGDAYHDTILTSDQLRLAVYNTNVVKWLCCSH